ncbi:MAG: alpha/beta fold hydrolase [Proteobacteria bacterium]|nr:alpha/beta fold hydrolase [Pseudomonadota bacterium]
MNGKPVWERDGRDWPNREASRFVQAGGLRWHVQVSGSGPAALLLHGTGASTHSWRDLAPLLARHFTVIAPDLPGHGFTATPPAARLSLDGMSWLLAQLMAALGVSPVLGIGHSAGAAILARGSLDGRITPAALVSINGALLMLRGLPGSLFAPLARTLARTSLAARLFAWRAGDPATVARLLDSTGSRIDPVGAALYARLARSPGHVAAALGMMANWDLRALEQDLPRLAGPMLLMTGDKDGTVPPAEAREVLRLVRGASEVVLPGLGHLAHEERPERTAAEIVHFARAHGLLSGAECQAYDTVERCLMD